MKGLNDFQPHDENKMADGEEGDDKSMTSTDILASSPMYFVLQRFLMTHGGTSIADELSNISLCLKSISKHLSRLSSNNEGRERKKARKKVNGRHEQR